MNKLCVSTGTIIFSYAGWYSGDLLGLQFVGCFLVSGFASLVGVWVGWKVAQKIG